MLLLHQGNDINEMYPRSNRRNERVDQNDSQRIVNEAKRGAFNQNPLLNTPHQILCENCLNKKNLVYLDYLKSGQFKLGETKPIEALHPYASGSVYEMEQTTPVIIMVKCDKCGSEIEVRPVSLEYLMFIIRKKSSELLYV